MISPVETDIVVITQPFHTSHKGVDLRTYENGIPLAIVATERSIVKRQGIDKYGNYFLVVTPLESKHFEIKYIHLNETEFEIGEELHEGEFISYSRIGGNSRAHHLHFETWDEYPFDPVKYFEEGNIQYRFK